MGSYVEAFRQMRHSLLGSDFLICIFAILNLVLLVITLTLYKVLKSKYNDSIHGDAETLMKLTGWISFTYNLFMTMITIFPLLGMLGTVMALLGLNLANGDMENIRNNFFLALTSTAWGIVFSVLYKLAHAVIEERVENQITQAKNLLKDNT